MRSHRLVRVAAGLVSLVSAWLFLATALVSAQSPSNVLTDGLLTLGDLPPTYRAVTTPVQEQFPPIPGLETLNVGFERDAGPVGLVSSIGRASSANAAHDIFKLMIDGAISGGAR